MFSRIKTLDNINGGECFKIISDRLIYCDKKSNLICAEKQRFKTIWKKKAESIQIIKKNSNNKILVLSCEGFDEFTYVLDLEGRITNSFNFNIYPILGLKDFFFIHEAVQEEIGIYNELEKKNLWRIKESFGGNCIGNRKYISYKKFDDLSIIITREIQTGKVHWKYSASEIGKYKHYDAYLNPLEKEGEVRRLIGVFDGVLVVNISGGNTQYEGQIIGIDAENGKLLWQIQNLNQRQIYHLRVNDAQTHLYALKDQEYLEISLGTAQITKQKNLGEVLKYNGNAIKVIDITSKGEHLFFTAMYEGKTFSSGLLGAFNTQTEKLDWIHDMEFGANCFFTASSAPTVEGNRLYALDKAGTLHIFEREEK
jgi:hypothetical protein